MNEAALRQQLFEVAYRMLGTTADAEEVVQDALTNWHANPRPEVESPVAWLSTVVTRASLDRLKSAQVRREQYVGPWLPEPLLTTQLTAEDDLSRAQRLSMACLAVLEQLSPLERAAFLLHEVFDLSHEEIGHALERTPSASRKLLERARQHVTDQKPRFAPTREAHQRLLEAFMIAVQEGDVGRLQAMLDEDVRSVGDGGGKGPAAKKPFVGRDAVVALWSKLRNLKMIGGGDTTAEIVELNGWPAVLIRVGGRAFSAVHIETDGQTIHTIRATLNPDKLAHL